MKNLAIGTLTQFTLIVAMAGSVAGCPPHPLPQDDVSSDLVPGCGDPANCNDPNGTGIYTAEGGSAGIGPSNMMILYFVNNGTSVSFQGVFHQNGRGPHLGRWQQLPELGSVVTADYEDRVVLPTKVIIPVLRIGLEVRSIREDDKKLPVWELWDTKRKVSTMVSGDALRRLSLHIQFGLAGRQGPSEQYVIDFAGTPDPHKNPDKNEQCSNATYNMAWTPETIDPEPQKRNPYCLRSKDNDSDSIVFQQHIFVDPRTSKVSYPQDDARVQRFVTVSCYLGAPATVARWGYEYDFANPSACSPTRGTSSHFYFDAAVQMKRASYCADEHAYTMAGTEISISDSVPVHQDAKPDPATIEASWTRDGATCLNLCQARHKELLSADPKCEDKHFSCNTTAIPFCGPRDITGGPKIYDGLPDAR
jgi:hypothetical protein